jgi:ABC-type Zn uptake system ZnuABC Zn-binding protein ZnuA
MRKYTLILAFGVALTLTACGSGSATNEATDSTAAQVDTAAVPTADSTAVVADSAKVEEVK